jgi:YjjG family noncanonical pyrimidine nucleotidase
MRKSYEFILLDADGTLFDYDRAEEFALTEAFRNEGLPFLPDSHIPAYREINERLWEEFEKKLISAADLRERRFRDLFDAEGIVGDYAAVSKRYLIHLAEAAFLYPEAENLLKALRPRYKLGIITNGLKEVQRSRFAGTPVGRYLDCIVVSDEVGVQKPDPAIFEHALAAAGHSDKNTSLIVGDSLTSDIQGGINFGIDTCWFNPGGKPNGSGIVPTYEIRRLPELLKIL